MAEAVAALAGRVVDGIEASARFVYEEAVRDGVCPGVETAISTTLATVRDRVEEFLYEGGAVTLTGVVAVKKILEMLG